jgi:hypothetical protein
MKYLIAIYGNEALWRSYPPEVFQEIVRDTDAHNADLQASGEFVGAYGLADEAQAKVVRVRDGVPAVTDGPYIEAKEHLASFTIVDCETEERALEIAAANPAARLGQVEVRPILHEAGDEM